MTKKETKYRVVAPLGSSILEKEEMNEEELRGLLPKIVQDPTTAETWGEIAQKESIEYIVDLLDRAGYLVEKL